MDFDSIISILFVFIFFVLPVILKRMKKKSGNTPVQKKKKPSVFERMGDQVQQFVAELEQQAAKGKDKGKKQDNIWKILSEEGKPDTDSGSLFKSSAIIDGKKTIIEDREPGPEKMTVQSQTGLRPKEKILAGRPDMAFQPGEYALNSRQKIRQAVVWSEILSRPMALRQK